MGARTITLIEALRFEGTEVAYTAATEIESLRAQLAERGEQIKPLLEFTEFMASQKCCETDRCCVDDPACDVMMARKALKQNAPTEAGDTVEN